MPNIIEQQDLLKGLPDNRLAMLMQSPTNDIPPFLVAAEAQRRQAIRQQYAGQGQNESVVDTLTKQMASVPQNVQAPMQTPPKMPAPMPAPMPPQMPQGGIGSLPQGMAAGGPVRRFAVGTLVTPTVDSVAASYFQDPFGAPSVAEAQAPGFSFGDYIISGLQSLPNSPVPKWKTEVDLAAEAETKTDAYVDPFVKAGRPAPYTSPPPKEKIKPDPNVGVTGTSEENKDKAESASYRKQLEELMGVDEPSNWEKAQKWFAMAGQIMDPNVNLSQGLVNAAAVYAQAEGGMAAERRAAEREMQKALLQYDIGERDYARQVAAQNRSDQLQAMKYQAESALKEAELYRKAADDASDALNRQVAAITSNSMGISAEEIAKDPTVKALQERVNRANEALRNATIRAQGFNTLFGNQYGLPAGFETSDGDTISTVGG